MERKESMMKVRIERQNRAKIQNRGTENEKKKKMDMGEMRIVKGEKREREREWRGD